MNFSDEQKLYILLYLGYSAKTISEDSRYYINIVADNINADYSSETIDMVTSLLDQIASVRSKLIASQDTMKTKRVGDIELNNDENSMLRSEERRLIKDLGMFLNIPMSKGGGVNFTVMV